MKKNKYLVKWNNVKWIIHWGTTKIHEVSWNKYFLRETKIIEGNKHFIKSEQIFKEEEQICKVKK
jgi:hypothetical protein